MNEEIKKKKEEEQSWTFPINDKIVISWKFVTFFLHIEKFQPIERGKQFRFEIWNSFLSQKKNPGKSIKTEKNETEDKQNETLCQ